MCSISAVIIQGTNILTESEDITEKFEDTKRDTLLIEAAN